MIRNLVIRVAEAALCLGAVATAFVTVLPISRSNEWWIRMWDFPRAHILGLAVLLAVLAFWLMRRRAFPLVVLLMASAIWQAYKIYPFTPLATVEVDLVSHEITDTVSLLSANVNMQNREYGKLAALIDEVSPDVLLLMETDAGWANALDETLSSFSTVLRHPLDNYYGMIFATKLATENAEIIFTVDDRTPAVLAELRAPGGRAFQFMGLHPRPPTPGQDTDDRDEEIRKAAQLAHGTGLPIVVMGDFNVVAWSWTAERFKHHGDFRDPRVGRGIFSSYDAQHPILRFPIDQLYLSEEIDLVVFERTRPVGSDHFPLHARIKFDETDAAPGSSD